MQLSFWVTITMPIELMDDTICTPWKIFYYSFILHSNSIFFLNKSRHNSSMNALFLKICIHFNDSVLNFGAQMRQVVLWCVQCSSGPAGGAGPQAWESGSSRNRAGAQLWAQMSASIVGIFSSKPAVDSNTVHLFKAISNMSCLTSFKSYLTPRNSHKFTVRIKEEDSQRQRNYHFHFVRCCCL